MLPAPLSVPPLVIVELAGFSDVEVDFFTAPSVDDVVDETNPPVDDTSSALSPVDDDTTIVFNEEVVVVELVVATDDWTAEVVLELVGVASVVLFELLSLSLLLAGTWKFFAWKLRIFRPKNNAFLGTIGTPCMCVSVYS